MLPLLLSPALNVSAGRAVQQAQLLPSGAELSARDLGSAEELARSFVDQGAARLVVIDVDAAQEEGDNLEIAVRIKQSTGAHVTLSGGIRSADVVERAFASGLDAVQLGTAALESPDFAAAMFARYGDRVTASLDVLEGELATHGRTVRFSGDLTTAVRELEQAGCRRFSARCLASDGRATGPNYELLGELCALTRTGSGAAVVVSGGVGSLEDLRRLRGLVPIGLEGVVVGTAFYQGLFSVADALQITEGERPLTSPLPKESA